MKDFFILLILQIGLVAMIGMIVTKPEPSDSAHTVQYAAIFAPGTSKQDVFLKVIQSGGTPVRHSSWDNVIISSSSTPHYIDNLKQNGAVFVISPFIQGGCITKDNTNFKTYSST